MDRFINEHTGMIYYVGRTLNEKYTICKKIAVSASPGFHRWKAPSNPVVETEAECYKNLVQEALKRGWKRV